MPISILWRAATGCGSSGGALARALGASGTARISAIADALAFRAARHQRFSGAAVEEHADDINEGIATYTQYVTDACH
jgi:hypothetical protein